MTTKKELIKLIAKDLKKYGFIECRRAIVKTPYISYMDYAEFRVCPRTSRIQFRTNDEYNFHLLENSDKEELFSLSIAVA